MSTLTTDLPVRPRTKLPDLLLPREHGAWGMLLVPLATSVGVVGRIDVPLALFTLAALALFCLRAPLEVLLGAAPFRARSEEEQRQVTLGLIFYGAVGLACASLVIWRYQRPGLLAFGALAGLFFVVQAGLKKSGRKNRLPAQLLAATALTSAAPGGFYVLTGRLEGPAWTLWLLNWLFALFQIFYVQLRIHSERVSGLAGRVGEGKGLLKFLSAAWLALASLAWTEQIPGMVLVAFIPLTLRGVAWFFQSAGALTVRRLGVIELAMSIISGALLVGLLRALGHG